ncbi:hypothetical protein Nepgr_004529 [Nepenthes gracilis]|uniref:AIG1-type G domain-containing protein n=1 Tax=Nepenthes gracilis TaxID=150966 RepID=A0AAD3S1J4_NEPGR|nr:hypothetical protein Nepgr_004529 [Nepenthes gracilis]
MDSKTQEETSSGIRAFPSPDESDSTNIFSYSLSKLLEIKTSKEMENSNSINSNSSGSISCGSDNENYDDNDDEGFVSGEEEFETASSQMHGFHETPESPIVGDEVDTPFVESMSDCAIPRAPMPMAKVSAENDDDGNDDDCEDVGGSYVARHAPIKFRVRESEEVEEDGSVREGEEVEEDGSKFVRLVCGYADSSNWDELVGEASSSEGGKVPERMEMELSNLEDEGGHLELKSLDVEGKKCDVDGAVASDMGNHQVSSVVVESTTSESGVVASNDMEFIKERDSVVEPIHANLLDTVKNGAAFVGEVDQSNDSEVKASDPSAVEDSYSADCDVDAVMTDIWEVGKNNVDITEGAETPAIEESASANSETNEVDGVFSSDGNSVVEAIYDDVKAIRSGATPVDGSVKFGIDFGSMVGSNSAEVGNDVDNLVQPVADGAESAEPVSSMRDADAYIQKENVIADVAAVTYNTLKQGASDKVDVGSLGGEAEILGPTENVAEKKAEPLVKIDENVDAIQVFSLVYGGKVQQVEHVNDSPQTDAIVGGVTKSGCTYASLLRDVVDDDALHEQLAEEGTVMSLGGGVEAEDDEHELHEQGDVEGSGINGESEGMIFGSAAATRQFIEEPVEGSGGESSHETSQRVDGQIVSESDEEADSGEEGGGKELFDSAALAALLKAATSAGSDTGRVTVTSQDGSHLFTVERPAGLGPSLRSIRPASRPNISSFLTPASRTIVPEESLDKEEKRKLENIQELRVKFLRLLQRVGHSAENSIAAQVLYRLALLAGRPTSLALSLENAKQTAMQLEAQGRDDLNFSLNILVLGKSGVGKSATINSIFGEDKVRIDAFEPATASVNEINGVVDGVKIRVFDTPGLKLSGMDQGYNHKILASVKKFMKRRSPDIVLYVDRLDSQTRDFNDLPLLRTISTSLGSSVWQSAIVTLTHAACAPPDGPSGSPLSYEVFVEQRSRIVQQSIGQAIGDLRLVNPSLLNPVSLVENHPSCRKNREGLKVLPDGQTWRPQLLLLCYSMKILSEASSLSKSQDLFDHRKLFGFRARSPPLPYLLSSLLQPRAYPKLAAYQGGDNGDSDIDLDDFSDTDGDEEDEYNQLPPFKPLRKFQIAKLSKEQRRAYFEEYDYRVKLLQKKQWKEELKRMREIKKGNTGADDSGEMPGEFDSENGSPSQVPVPLPDMVLPPSFDSDNPAYRYRFLEPTSEFLARPVLDTHGWDHDCGYDGVNIEQNLGIAGRFPAVIAVQVTKDKKEINIHLDSSISAKHGNSGSSLAGFDIQNIGKQLAYILRGETKFRNLKKNKTAAGLSVTFLGENVATGVKVEDQFAVGKRVVLVGSAGTICSRKDAAYGANLEVRLRDSDYPIGQDHSSFVLSLMKWRGDLALGANLQCPFSIGRNSKMAVRLALNNKLSGQISVRTTSSDHLQLALAALIPIAMAIYGSIRPWISESYSIY